MSLKIKAVNSFGWTAFEGIFSQGFIFLVGIILARLLTPQDFGIIAIMTSFITISNSIIEGGFTSALLREINTTDDDYNTVFYTNLITGFILYILVFIAAKPISVFFDITELNPILKITGFLLILNALSIIQKTILTKKLDFKKQALISIVSASIGGGIAILMAYQNYGVWSLVALVIIKPFINCVLLWLTSAWKPKLKFSNISFKRLFNYGYKVLITNLINTTYQNIYSVLIAKMFSPISLGYYTRAEQFQKPVSMNLALAINRISFPILSEMQNDSKRLKSSFKRFLRFSMLLNFTMMMALSAMAEPIIIILIGTKWTKSVFLLQLLCIPAMLYPLQILHLNLLLIKGYSNLNLKLEILKKLILIPIILITASINLNAMVYGLILFALIEYLINSYYTIKLINYSLANQLNDIFPFLLISISLFFTMYIYTFLTISVFYILILQIFTGIIIFILLCNIFRLKEYNELVLMIRRKLPFKNK